MLISQPRYTPDANWFEAMDRYRLINTQDSSPMKSMQQNYL